MTKRSEIFDKKLFQFKSVPGYEEVKKTYIDNICFPISSAKIVLTISGTMHGLNDTTNELSDNMNNRSKIFDDKLFKFKHTPGYAELKKTYIYNIDFPISAAKRMLTMSKTIQDMNDATDELLDNINKLIQ